ncbi:MAG: hypothetical protein HC942_06125 [Microcoleus sp. SU_5_6]|nr:hypothetical protein [Microcoleus sp. SU_5_6]
MTKRIFRELTVPKLAVFLPYAKEEGRRKKEEGRRKREEGRRKKEEGKRKKVRIAHPTGRIKKSKLALFRQYKLPDLA